MNHGCPGCGVQIVSSLWCCKGCLQALPHYVRRALVEARRSGGRWSKEFLTVAKEAQRVFDRARKSSETEGVTLVSETARMRYRRFVRSAGEVIRDGSDDALTLEDEVKLGNMAAKLLQEMRS